jgi:ribosomal protein S12 methylthiotransferase accessory factor YcaO
VSADHIHVDPETHALKQRVRKLTRLRRQIDAELADLNAQIAAIEALDELAQAKASREKYKRGSRKPCGTEEGYQWHRHWERDTNWPLPKEDPCGCRAAHRERERQRRIAAELEEVAQEVATAC